MRRIILWTSVLTLFIYGFRQECLGSLLVADYDTNSVLQYDSSTGAFLGTFASGGGLSHYSGITLGPDGNLYVSTSPSSLNAAGGVLRFNGSTGAFLGTFVPAGGGGLTLGEGLTFGPDGNLYVASFVTGDGTQPGAILRYNGQTGAFIGAFVAPGSGGLLTAQQCVFGPDGNLYVADNDRGQVLRYNGKTGAFMDAFVPVGSGGLINADGLVFGPDGNLYVSDGGRRSVLRYDGHSGAFLDNFVPGGSGGLGIPFGIEFGPNGNLFVSSAYTNQGIYQYDGKTGTFVDQFAKTPAAGPYGPFYFVFSSSVPEPSTLILFGIGSVGLLGYCCRRERASSASA
jgi:streptogramin lyase